MENLIIKYFLYTIVIILTGAIITVAFSYFLSKDQFIEYKGLIQLISLSSGLIFILLMSNSHSLLWNFYKKSNINSNQIYLLLLFFIFSMVLEYLINDDIYRGRKITVIRALQTFLVIPVLEELVFRGVFQNRLTQSYGWKLGILITSILFMLIHYGQLDQMILSVIFSFLSGYLFHRTNSLLLCVVFHVLVNIGIFMLGNFCHTLINLF